MAVVFCAVLAALLCVVALVIPPAAVAADTTRAPNFSAEALLLVDPDGRVIYAKNADNERAPASLVKLMTLYLACEDLDAGRVDVDEIVSVSRHAATVGRYRMGLRTGEEVPVHVLLEGVAIASANDAASALAERLGGGDEAVFVARMNDKARDLGLTGTRFANPHGLPDPIQRSNARDLATLTGRLIHDYPMSGTSRSSAIRVACRRSRRASRRRQATTSPCPRGAAASNSSWSCSARARVRCRSSTPRSSCTTASSRRASSRRP